MKKQLTEFIGTFFLVFTIHGVVVGGGAPIGIGIALMALIYMGGSISGAHYNPAVTLALLTLKKISTSEALSYIIAQVIGATAAAAIGTFCFGRSFAPTPGIETSAVPALFIELLFTLMLVLTILNVAVSKRTSGNPYFGLAIGGVIVAGALSGGGFSGGAYNPAVGIGPTLVHMGSGQGTLEHLWIYLVGPVVGGQLAAILFQMQEVKEPATE